MPHSKQIKTVHAHAALTGLKEYLAQLELVRGLWPKDVVAVEKNLKPITELLDIMVKEMKGTVEVTLEEVNELPE